MNKEKVKIFLNKGLKLLLIAGLIFAISGGVFAIGILIIFNT